jgi:arginyl-tRNA--protein-N-Asp/Glu arginylyltransferase
MKTNVKTAFRTNNTIQKLLLHKQQITDIHSQSGVYKLTCPDCGKVYVGQTARNFATRFKEHKNAFRIASHSSNFAKHLIEHTHSFGPIHNTTQILHLQNKGALLNTLEQFHIYTEYTNNNHLNVDSTISHNKIFDIL